jgi:hypothetical protein
MSGKKEILMQMPADGMHNQENVWPSLSARLEMPGISYQYK